MLYWKMYYLHTAPHCSRTSFHLFAIEAMHSRYARKVSHSLQHCK